MKIPGNKSHKWRNMKFEAADAKTCLVCPRKRKSTWLEIN